MRRARFSKFLEYAAGFFLFAGCAMSFSRWFENVDFYPSWLIALCFALFVAAFARHRKLVAAKSEKFTKTARRAIDETNENRQVPPPKMSFEEAQRAEAAAHRLIVALCESNNITLRQKQPGGSGHYDIPKIWTFEKPMPLSPAELDAIVANPVLRVETKLDENGQVWAERFTMSDNWIVYETGK